MIKAITTIGIILILAIGGWNLYKYWGQYSDDNGRLPEAAGPAVTLDPKILSGLPDKLEVSLETASKRGGVGLRNWLNLHRKQVEDPRLAWIELDCCIMLIQTDAVEAKKLFHSVQARLAPSSPVYPRLKQLEKAFP